MKKTRRHELKTNELSVLLKEVYAKLSEYANYIIVGLVAAVLVLIIGFVVRHNRMAAEQIAWQTYYDVREGNVIEQPELLDRAATLAAQQAGDRVLEPLALELQADLAYHLAVGPGTTLSREEKIRNLTRAQSLYEELLSRFAHRPATADRLRMSLAATGESLGALDPSLVDLDAIRELYQAVIEGEPTAFQPLAQERLDTLTERMQPLQVVATRPADPPDAQEPEAMVAPAEEPEAQETDEPTTEDASDEPSDDPQPIDAQAQPE
jgi:hypothetical protein